MTTQRLLPPALTLSLSTVLACGTVAPDPEPGPDPTPAPFDPAAYEVLSYDLGERDGEAEQEEGEEVWVATRFRMDAPGRIVAIEAMWNVSEDDDEETNLGLYPDRGHNFFSYDRENPLWFWEGDLNKDEHDDEWTLYELDPPLEIAHPQLLYLASRHDGGPGQPALGRDDAITRDPFLEDKMSPEEWAFYTPYVAHYPDRPLDSISNEAMAFGGVGTLASHGDLMVRLYIEREPEAPKWFTEVTADLGSGLPSSGSVSFGDCDNDGWEDVWTGGSLFHNRGDGTFEDLTASSGITHGGNGVWGDYDNDGDLDLFLAADDDRLYEAMGECQFVDVTAASGIDDTQPFDQGSGLVDVHAPTPAAAWVDYDLDGLLDLYLANFLTFTTYDKSLDMLYRNLGDGLFEDQSVAAGIRSGEGSGGLGGRGVIAADWDNDLDPDIYVSNYGLDRNLAYFNEGGSFAEAGRDSDAAGHPNSQGLSTVYGHTIGTAAGDVDNDLDIDLFAATLAHPRYDLWSDKSMFLRNQWTETGAVDWVDVRDESGMLYQETDSSPIFLDIENDGWLDLFYTAVYPARPSYLYRNLRDGRFEMVSWQAGTWIWDGWGVAGADIDNDGDTDIYGKKVYRNDHPEQGHWIKVRALGSGTGATNASGIGAKVYLSWDGGAIVREVHGTVGTGNQDSLWVLAGIGDAARARVEVEFPATGTRVDAGEHDSGAVIVVHEDGTVQAR